MLLALGCDAVYATLCNSQHLSITCCFILSTDCLYRIASSTRSQYISHSERTLSDVPTRPSRRTEENTAAAPRRRVNQQTPPPLSSPFRTLLSPLPRHRPTMITIAHLALSILSLASYAAAQGDLTAANNMTDLEGTWSSNPAVMTGGVSPAAKPLMHPLTRRTFVCRLR